MIYRRRATPLHAARASAGMAWCAALVTVALLHVAGALKHHFIDRNSVLRRMLPFGGVK